MGLILDSSVLIADERSKFDMPRFLNQFPKVQPVITVITASLRNQTAEFRHRHGEES